MSIPLDRLYHYLEGLISEDIIIYRWCPHGSKKLEHLTPANNQIPEKSDFLNHMTKVSMICHDQEPLFYNYYSEEQFRDIVDDLANSRKNIDPPVAWCKSENFLAMLTKSHLRLMTTPFLSLNDNLLLCHSEQNSEELKKYEQNGFIGVYYWAHAVIARDWFRYAESDLELDVDFDSIKHDFLIYNRAWSGTREYRLKITELLHQHNLLPQCNIKFNPWDNNVHYCNHKFKNQLLSVTTTDLEKTIPLNTASTDFSADYVNTDYTQSGIEVVLETLFDDCRHHLTEKSLRPIACGRPFILAATPGSLKYLKQYGFKTFGDYIDESYDQILDPLARLQAIVNEMQRITQLGATDKRLLWKNLYQIAEYNKARFFSKDFHSDIVNEFKSNVDIGVKQCKSTMTGKWWRAATDVEQPTVTVLSTAVNNWLEQYNKSYDGDFSITPSQSSPGSCSA